MKAALRVLHSSLHSLIFPPVFEKTVCARTHRRGKDRDVKCDAKRLTEKTARGRSGRALEPGRKGRQRFSESRRGDGAGSALDDGRERGLRQRVDPRERAAIVRPEGLHVSVILVVVIYFDGPIGGGVMMMLGACVRMPWVRPALGRLGVEMRRPANFERGDRQALDWKRQCQQPDQDFHVAARGTPHVALSRWTLHCGMLGVAHRFCHSVLAASPPRRCSGLACGYTCAAAIKNKIDFGIVRARTEKRVDRASLT